MVIPERLSSALLCLFVFAPLGFLWLRSGYRFALQHLFLQPDREEVRKQYHILLACLGLGVVMGLTNTWLVGLLISVLLFYLSGRIIRSQVTMIPGTGWRERGLLGKRALFGALFCGVFAVFFFLMAVGPYVSDTSRGP